MSARTWGKFCATSRSQAGRSSGSPSEDSCSKFPPRPRCVRKVAHHRLAHILILVTLTLTITACGASIRPLPPRTGVPTAVAPPDATDREYFTITPLMVPVVGVSPKNIPDTFNEPRDGGRIHRATDILAPQGTPVVAATSGKILRMSQSSLGGITIYMLDDQSRFLYYYAHLDHYSNRVSPGIRVAQGTVLGYVGMTGNAPVPHLHFQAMRWDPHRKDYWNSTAVDVRPFFSITGTARDNE